MFGLPLLKDAETRSISAENPTGERGGGAKEYPSQTNPAAKLGRGWKVRPCITLPPKTATPLAKIEGPGVITHIWMTVSPRAYRDCVLRIFWDGEFFPSVEVPLGDFFVNGHGLRYDVNSLVVAVNPDGGFNCFWPMPFRGSCEIFILNRGNAMVEGFFYQITYELGKIPPNSAYFHAQGRRRAVDPRCPEYVIVEGLQGQGHYVGTALFWTQLTEGWWGEGEVKFFIDGDGPYPTICGTGTEDYFGGAWGFGRTYSTTFLGYPLWRKEESGVCKHAMYRWHILDPIRFKGDLRVTIQALGWDGEGRYFRPLSDEIASVAYWYQTEPHNPWEEK